MNINIKKTAIDGLLSIERPVYPDERGFFHEVFRVDELIKATGLKFNAVQLGHSMSKPGVIRGIHTENWQKVVYPVTGKMFTAFVDMRPSSKTFLEVVTHVFDNSVRDVKHTAFYLPPGIGNSICVLGDEPVHYIYAVDEYWDNSKAIGVAWDDPDINIPWPIKDPIISDRDRKNPTLRELFPEKFDNKK